MGSFSVGAILGKLTIFKGGVSGDCTWEQFSSMWGEEGFFVDEGMESKEDAKAFMAKMKELSC